MASETLLPNFSSSHYRSSSRSRSASANVPPSPNKIFFPKAYEEAWGSVTSQPGLDLSPIERARIFLLRFANMNPDPTNTVNPVLRSIIVNGQDSCRTVPDIASAIQMRIFKSRHPTFEASPLLQAVRFMLIKGGVNGIMYSECSQDVIDFFFDPVIARNLVPPPYDPVEYECPQGTLKVVIVGGGPTGLASAVSLAEKGQGKVQVHVYEKRWVKKQGPNGPYVGYPPTAKRRDQVVTLQDTVTNLLSKPTFEALFAGRPERVWPGSANIQIRKVEDRLLGRCQDPELRGLIHLHAEGLAEAELSKAGDFHVLVGADGAASWVRKAYFNGYENERGRSFALGLAFDRPAGLPWSQPLNIFLTLGQTRYLLNASDHDGRGYLNMQLTEEEWHKMVALDGEPVTFGKPGCLRRPDSSVPEGFKESDVFAPSENRDSAIWQSIEDGLKLFGFKEEEVINVVRIPIVVQGVREGVQYLPQPAAPHIHRPHALVGVAGDACATVHFWPGRGLNSGIKSGMALGDEIVIALNNGRFKGMNLDAMKEYNDFIVKLQAREHDKRSIPILNQSGSPEMLGWLLDKAQAIPDTVATEWLVGAMTQIGARLQGRSDWNYEVVRSVEPQIRIVLRQMRPLTLREMAASFPWPTREMTGAEVLPIRSMRPEEKESWVNQLWKMIRDDKDSSKSKRLSTAGVLDGETISAGRFEAPKQGTTRPVSISFSPSPPTGSLEAQPSTGLRRSGAKSIRSTSPLGRMNRLSISGESMGIGAVDPGSRQRGRAYSKAESLMVPSTDGDQPASHPEEAGTRGRAMSAAGDSLVRLMSTKKKPGDSILTDAMSLALFRVD